MSAAEGDSLPMERRMIRRVSDFGETTARDSAQIELTRLDEWLELELPFGRYRTLAVSDGPAMARGALRRQG